MARGPLDKTTDAQRIGSRANILKLPLLAAVIVFVVAVFSTQLALQLENREADRQTERLAKVYLDGLEASTRASVRVQDWPAVDVAFRNAFTAQEGIAEKALLLIDSSGAIKASVADRADLVAPPAIVSGAAFLFDEGAGVAWARRSTDSLQGHALVAALDISGMVKARRNLFWIIALVDLLVAALCGLAAYAALRRVGRPVEGLLALLRDGARRPEPIPPSLAAKAGKDLAPVLDAYNAMVDGLRDRDRLRTEIAERAQAAALGRLAATLAHEVRNPLGGLATAVNTLKKFGADTTVRSESLEFLARGIDSLETLVARTLNVYRPEEERRLRRDDLEDIRLLVAPAAARQDVEIVFHLDLPASFEIAASGVRQVLLNLVLNAVGVSPRAGCVRLDARIEDSHLICVVSDEGPGMEHDNIRRLLGETPGSFRSRRIGIDAIVAILGDLDARVSVNGTDGGGTTVRVEIPIGRQRQIS
jgi:two-component system OmpR family sensor kinase